MKSNLVRFGLSWGQIISEGGDTPKDPEQLGNIQNLGLVRNWSESLVNELVRAKSLKNISLISHSAVLEYYKSNFFKSMLFSSPCGIRLWGLGEVCWIRIRIIDFGPSLVNALTKTGGFWTLSPGIFKSGS